MKGPQKAECSCKEQRGFTLLEVLVAITILTIGLLGMASLTVGIIKANNFTKQVTTATTLAQDKMEKIRNTVYSSIASEQEAALPSPYEQYKCKVDVTEANNMKTVTVTLSWVGANPMVLETIISH